MFTVKICGVRSVEDIDLCAGAGADAVGLIFAASPARIDVWGAARLCSRVPSGIVRVGVFAHHDAAFVDAVLSRCDLDALQFCGGETPDFCGSFGKPTIFVVAADPAGGPLRFKLPDRRMLERARARMLLVDARLGTTTGGTGQRLPPAFAAQAVAESPLPVVLAGGLSASNVSEAIAAVCPAAVDVRSGVEQRGRKVPQLVRDFVKAARLALSYTAHDAAKSGGAHAAQRA